MLISANTNALNLASIFSQRAYAHDAATGRTYDFTAYGISERPGGTMDVYAFCRTAPGGFDPLYVGRASDLNSRLAGHEKVDDAIALGANALLVHSPPNSLATYLSDIEAELISLLNPPLNVQHRGRSAFSYEWGAPR